MSKNLVAYLENLVNLEKSVYIQEHAIREIKDRIDRLGISYKIDEPSTPDWSSTDYEGILPATFAGAIIAGFFSLDYLIPGAIIGFTCMYLLNRSIANGENRKKEAEYTAAKERYNKALTADRLRVNREKSEKQKLSETLRTMESKLRDTKSLLSRFYSQDIIFPKYRNLVSICSFYEYFLSGRCTTLTGHEGAYNIFETEVRFERIYTKLDEVVSKLEDIKSNQYMLYDAIQDGNRTTQKLVNESVKQAKLTESIAHNAELSAHYSRQTAMEANQMKWLALNEKIDKS